MSTNSTSEREGNSQTKKSVNDWKYPKIPIDKVYKKRILNIAPTYVIEDYEDTITVHANDQNVSGSLLSSKFFKSFIKAQHRFVHLGLVQIAIKPLVRDGLGAPIVVSLRDARHLDFHNSLLALVKANLSHGPLYFDCFPSFSVSLDDASLSNVLTIDVETGGIPLALTYRIVCKAMVDLSPEALKEPVLGETTCYHPATGTRTTTKWDESELKVHESSTSKQEPKAQDEDIVHTLRDDCFLNKGKTISKFFANEKEGSSQNRTRLDDWEYPKIPVKRVYDSKHHKSTLWPGPMKSPSLWSKAKKAFGSQTTVKDYENTVTLEDNNQINVSLDLLRGFIKAQNEGLVDLGLVQIAIKPLMSEGLEAPILVCLRDTRTTNFKYSVFALVQANLSKGPFYFNCSPGFSMPLSHCFDFLMLHVISRVPLVLTYRLVCNVTAGMTLTSGLILDRRKLMVCTGETTYYQPYSGTDSTTTKWDEVQLPESWAQMWTSSGD